MTVIEGGHTRLAPARAADVAAVAWFPWLKSALVGLDTAVVAAVTGGAWLSLARPGDDALVAALAVLVALALLARARLYSSRFITRRSDEARRIAGVAARTAAIVGLVVFAADLQVARSWVAFTAVGLAAGLNVERELVRRWFDRSRREGRLRRRIVVVGDNAEGRELISMFEQEPELGYDVVAVVEAPAESTGREVTTRVLALAREHQAVGAVVVAGAVEGRASNRLVRDLTEAGIHVELSSSLADLAPERLTLRPLGRFPVFYIEPVRRGGWRAVAKRSFDLVVASSLCLVLAPVLAAIYVAVKVGSPGPALFRQTRVGQDAEPFEVLKFRTMVVDAEKLLADLRDANEGAGPLFKMKDDPRVTPVGRILRKTSLDELPQLWNVVRGEMSLVGPRPALASEMAAWHEDLYGRLRVKPGITGMWQVSGRSEASFEDYTRLDLYYVDNWSLVVDLAILAKTIPSVLRSDGAY